MVFVAGTKVPFLPGRFSTTGVNGIQVLAWTEGVIKAVTSRVLIMGLPLGAVYQDAIIPGLDPQADKRDRNYYETGELLPRGNYRSRPLLGCFSPPRIKSTTPRGVSVRA